MCRGPGAAQLAAWRHLSLARATCIIRHSTPCGRVCRFTDYHTTIPTQASLGSPEEVKPPPARQLDPGSMSTSSVRYRSFGGTYGGGFHRFRGASPTPIPLTPTGQPKTPLGFTKSTGGYSYPPSHKPKPYPHHTNHRIIQPSPTKPPVRPSTPPPTSTYGLRGLGVERSCRLIAGVGAPRGAGAERANGRRSHGRARASDDVRAPSHSLRRSQHRIACAGAGRF